MYIQILLMFFLRNVTKVAHTCTQIQPLCWDMLWLEMSTVRGRCGGWMMVKRGDIDEGSAS